MAKSTRRPQRIFSAVMWLLSIIFAGFLIGLGSLIIKDLPQVDRKITTEQFVDKDELRALDTLQTQQTAQSVTLRRAAEDARRAHTSARADYSAAKTSFDNWIATRSATESAAQNPEVLARTRIVEGLAADERTALRAFEDAEAAQTALQREIADRRTQRQRLLSAGRPEYNAALRGRELRVFMYRLALTLPLLLLGGYLAAKKRASSYWPLYRGVVIFALFAFFVELVPYLPSYGGYVRYLVGIIMVVAAGHFIIRGMRRYMERKQAEEARSEGERRQSIEYETALKKIAAKSCPGCDRAIITREGVDTHYCVHCGIHLQVNCHSCDHLNISFHRFCLSCGVPARPVQDAEPAASV